MGIERRPPHHAGREERPRQAKFEVGRDDLCQRHVDVARGARGVTIDDVSDLSLISAKTMCAGETYLRLKLNASLALPRCSPSSRGHYEERLFLHEGT